MSEPVEEKRTVVVVGPDGQPVGTMQLPEQDSENPDGEDPGSLIQQPAKVMRIGSMIKQLLEEVKAAPLDEASRVRLKEIHASSVKELEDGLAPELVEELERLSLLVAQAFRHCGDGWMLHVHSVRRPCPGYLPPGAFPDATSALIDEEGRRRYCRCPWR